MADEEGADAVATAEQAKALVLRGTLDASNPLAMLRGNALVLEHVVRQVEDEQRRRRSVRMAPGDAFMVCNTFNYAACRDGLVVFPESRGTNVNMLPFKLFQPLDTLPESCRRYADMIDCLPVLSRNFADFDNRVAYLTVHESDVEAGSSQRRPGLHVERPGVVGGGGGRKSRFDPNKSDNAEYFGLCWGLGHVEEGHPVDGLYVASTVDDSCTVWPALIERPEEVSDASGGIEPLREYLGEGRRLKAGELCWMTDRTPHESNAVAAACHRQFFRVVVGPISVWYSKHNTANPLVPPDAPVSDIPKLFSSPAG